MQNEYHIKYLKNLLNIDTNFYSVVVFSNDCEFKSIKRNKNSGTVLIQRYELIRVIKHLILNSNQVLSSSEIDKIYNILYPYSQVDEITKIKHITNIGSK